MRVLVSSKELAMKRNLPVVDSVRNLNFPKKSWRRRGGRDAQSQVRWGEEPLHRLEVEEETMLDRQKAVIKTLKMIQGDSPALCRMRKVLKMRSLLITSKIQNANKWVSFTGPWLLGLVCSTVAKDFTVMMPHEKMQVCRSLLAGWWMLTEPLGTGSTESSKSIYFSKHLAMVIAKTLLVPEENQFGKLKQKAFCKT